MSRNQLVSNSAELKDALREAQGGETILLKAGAHFRLDLGDERYAETVTIRSQAGGDKAVLDRVKLQDVANLTIDDVVFDGAKAQRPDWMPDLFIDDGRNITISNSTMKGDARAFNDGDVHVGVDGVRVSDTVGFRFIDNEVSHYNFGLKVVRSDRVLVSDNDFHHMQADGMQFADVDDVTIEANHLHDFLGSLFAINHNDMIQFFTSHTTSRSENIVIRGNVLDSGDGHWTQGIFLGNERGIAYRNVLIEDNTIHNNSFNGITVATADNVAVRSNTVLMNRETEQTEFRNENIFITVKDGSTGVTVADNIAGRIDVSSGDRAFGNIVVNYDDPRSDTYFRKILDFAGQKEATHVEGIELSLSSDLVRKLLELRPNLGSSLTRPAEIDEPSLPPEKPPVTPPRPTPEPEPDPSPIEHGTARNDRMLGDGGDDIFKANAGNDLLKGFGGDDTLYGDAGIDHLVGGDGNDRLYGGAGRDMMWGDRGNDRLDGGQGLDHYIGGAGEDVFVLVKGEIAADRILDYRNGEDRIALYGFGDDATVTRDGQGHFTVEDGGYSAKFAVLGYFGAAQDWFIG